MKTQKFCKVRSDLRRSELSVCIGSLYYGGNARMKYRWIDEQFQVFYLNQWMDAESIDFEFTQTFKTHKHENNQYCPA